MIKYIRESGNASRMFAPMMAGEECWNFHSDAFAQTTFLGMYRERGIQGAESETR
jgi:hypothetical protein